MLDVLKIRINWPQHIVKQIRDLSGYLDIPAPHQFLQRHDKQAVNRYAAII